uniref:Glyoxalase domain-containing protein 4 n=1 Tax=Hucho hucho TaxID=62062 RepID=A0A4W5LF77_9TELE
VALRRALHFVFKVGDGSKTATFYRDGLSMKILRHKDPGLQHLSGPVFAAGAEPHRAFMTGLPTLSARGGYSTGPSIATSPERPSANCGPLTLAV